MQEEIKKSSGGPKAKNIVKWAKKAFSRKNNPYVKMSGDFAAENQPNNEFQAKLAIEQIVSSPNTLKVIEYFFHNQSNKIPRKHIMRIKLHFQQENKWKKISYAQNLCNISLIFNSSSSNQRPFYQQEHKDTLGDNENHMEKLQLSPKFGTVQTAIEIRDRTFVHNSHTNLPQ